MSWIWVLLLVILLVDLPAAMVGRIILRMGQAVVQRITEVSLAWEMVVVGAQVVMEAAEAAVVEVAMAEAAAEEEEDVEMIHG